ncbi:cyclic nucleotide-binding domain-containing protein [Streptomyces sp. NPDC002012]|uniref:Crp/Fnr family transcriptional regulator n=1 Tax=Streptomyces sp. NPDC002012 TaxID=3154532 RepID=UPI00331EFEE6
MSTARSLFDVIPPESRARLFDEAAHEVPLVLDARLFEEGRRADRFWVIRSGPVEVDLHLPGRRAAVIEMLGQDDLLGWSWLFPPHVWHLGAHVIQAGQAVEFNAAAVRSLCEADAVLGRAVYKYVAGRWRNDCTEHGKGCCSCTVPGPTPPRPERSGAWDRSALVSSSCANPL